MMVPEGQEDQVSTGAVPDKGHAPPPPLRPGELRQGRISQVEPDRVLVEIDSLEGIVPRDDLDKLT